MNDHARYSDGTRRYGSGSAHAHGHLPTATAAPADAPTCRFDESVADDRVSYLQELSASVAQKLVTPLTNLMDHLQPLAAELCRDAEPDARTIRQMLGKRELAEHALLAIAGAQRMRDAVTHIAAVALVADRANVEEVAMTAALDAAIEMGERESVLRVRVAKLYDDVPSVVANQEQLVHALLSVLVAAAHSSEDGDPRGNELQLLVCADEDDVIVEIVDSCRGPRTRTSDEWLDPFPISARDGNGFGLGLSLCATAIASFGGQVLVGRGGGRFVVRLPRAHSARAASRRGGASPRDLVVYDEPVA